MVPFENDGGSGRGVRSVGVFDRLRRGREESRVRDASVGGARDRFREVDADALVALAVENALNLNPVEPVLLAEVGDADLELGQERAEISPPIGDSAVAHVP